MSRFGNPAWVLAIAHALMTVCVFTPAIYNPRAWGLLPSVAFYSDFPLSIAYSFFEELLMGILGLRGRLILDGLLTLFVGSAWWFFMGVLLIEIWRKLFKSAEAV
jgi:hypothetical protein